jgi:hypothetical protein
MPGDSSLHGWGDADRLMNPAELVMHVMKGYRRLQILDFLRKSVREPGKSAHGHAHRKILALHNRRTNVLDARVA